MPVSFHFDPLNPLFVDIAAMRPLSDLADTMRADWDRRVQHDYRFWISNELSPQSIMWEDGARDFTTLHQGLTPHISKTALEIGCGVGRMLRAAAKLYGRVIGVDISPKAINKARELIGLDSTIKLIANSGYDLSGIADTSIDFVWSYASLAHMPVRVLAAYLVEIKRVLRPTGCAKLQIFLGKETDVAELDTLRIRSFVRANFDAALKEAGLRVGSVAPAHLPLSSIVQELGLEAFIIAVQPTEQAAGSIDAVASALNPRGESQEGSSVSGTQFEAWLAMSYADRMCDDRDYDRARSALDYVSQYCQAAGIDTRDTLDRLTQMASTSRSRAELSTETPRSDVYAANLELLRQRFPDIYDLLERVPATAPDSVEVRSSLEGPVLWCRNTCLDHAEKPKAAGEAWVKRSLNDPRYSRSRHLVVVGLGAGYHLESFLSRATHKISCVEPSVESLRRILEARDMRPILSALTALHISAEPPERGWDSDSELLIRPQAAAVFPVFCETVTKNFYATRGLTALHPKIAVLGPLQGGTLPIGMYTTAALQQLGQRIRGIDLSGFNGAFELIGSLVSEKDRLSLARQTYAETLSSVLLENFSEKPIDILICMAQAPITPRALTELRRRGVITVLWFLEDYLRFTYWREMAKYYDFVFTIQKGECIEAIRKAGAAHVHYLPAACDPAVHAPCSLTEDEKKRWGSPISFVGAGYYNRQESFARLSRYPFKIWGSEWPLCKPFDKLVQEDSRRLSPDEYVKIFSATDININLHSSSERADVDPTGDFVNPRTFELAACGAFQLVDERSLLNEAFVPGEELVTFRSTSDLKDKIDYYIERPEERRRIALQGRERALRDHSYQKRLQQMLTIIYSHSYQKLQVREQSNPWAEMIRRAAFDPELKEKCERSRDRGEEPGLDGLVAEIALGKGTLTPTEQKLLFLHHVTKQIVRMNKEEEGRS
jgi:spore maturation protein CgeB